MNIKKTTAIEDGVKYDVRDYKYVKKWFLNTKLHRVNGPAMEYKDGNKVWFVNNMMHRTDGPALEHVDGSKVWYVKDKLHREDGPAVEGGRFTEKWYLNGEEYTKPNYYIALLNRGLVTEEECFLELID